MRSTRPSSLAAAALLLAASVGLGARPAAAAITQVWAQTHPSVTDYGGITLADIDGDGQNEILHGGHDGLLRVQRADGSTLWQASVNIAGTQGVAIDTTPTVADLDGDGRKEIIVGAMSIQVPNQQGGIEIFNSDGSPRCTWQGQDTHNEWNPAVGATPDGYREGVRSVPAVGDIDGDGKPDIAFGGLDLRFYVINAACQVKASFYHDDTIFSSPALHDVDGDGKQEIFFGGDSTAGGPEDWAGGVFRALKWQNGGLVEMWKQRVPMVLQSSPAIGDIDGDGRFEVVTGTSNVQGTGANLIYAWHLDNGSPVPGWPVATEGPTFGSPALADLDGDGLPEVVDSDLSGKIGAWKGNGARLWYVDPHRSGEGGGEITSSPVVADLDGDGRQDVVTANGWGTFLLRGSDGSRLASPIGIGWSYHNVPAVGLLGGQWRLVIAGFNSTSTRIASYAIPTSPAAPAWPQFKQRADHVGGPGRGGTPLAPGMCSGGSNPRPAPSASASHGYWFLGGDGAVYSFGGAPFLGSLPGLGVRTTTVSMAPTPSGNGYWVLGADGGVFSFGDARFFGGLGGIRLNAPVRAIVSTPSGNGYWILGGDGGIFTFGDAPFYGSTGGTRLNAPVVGMARTPDGGGYWLLGADGGVFTFGDAPFYGSTGSLRLNAPVISMTAGPAGYWLLGGDGGVFTFGVPYYGSLPGTGLCSPPPGVVLRSTLTGRGYWVLGGDGGVFSFGDAPFGGSQPGLTGRSSAADMAIRP